MQRAHLVFIRPFGCPSPVTIMPFVSGKEQFSALIPLRESLFMYLAAAFLLTLNRTTRKSALCLSLSFFISETRAAMIGPMGSSLCFLQRVEIQVFSSKAISAEYSLSGKGEKCSSGWCWMRLLSSTFT